MIDSTLEKIKVNIIIKVICQLLKYGVKHKGTVFSRKHLKAK